MESAGYAEDGDFNDYGLCELEKNGDDNTATGKALYSSDNGGYPNNDKEDNGVKFAQEINAIDGIPSRWCCYLFGRADLLIQLFCYEIIASGSGCSAGSSPPEEVAWEMCGGSTVPRNCQALAPRCSPAPIGKRWW